MTAKNKHRIISGKRKTAVAKLNIMEGTGNIFFNKLPSSELALFHKLALLEPIRIYQSELGSDFHYDFYSVRYQKNHNIYIPNFFPFLFPPTARDTEPSARDTHDRTRHIDK